MYIIVVAVYIVIFCLYDTVNKAYSEAPDSSPPQPQSTATNSLFVYNNNNNIIYDGSIGITADKDRYAKRKKNQYIT